MEVLFPGLSSALNVHPLFVHFPIVLWLTALLFWGLALWLEREVLWDVGRWLLESQAPQQNIMNTITTNDE